MKYRVRNQDGTDERWAQADKLQDAAKDGYLPVVASTSDTSGRRVGSLSGLVKAAQDGYTPDYYVEQYGMSEATKAADKAGFMPAGEMPTARESAVGGLVNGATFGFNDEIAGAAAKLGGYLAPALGELPGMGTPQVPEGDIYTQERDAVRADNQAQAQANPVPFIAGQVLGGLATSAVLPGSTATEVLPMAAKAGIEGAAAGLGASTADNPLDMAKDTVIGGTVGATLGGGIGAVGKVSEGLGTAAESAGAKALGINSRDAAAKASRLGSEVSPQEINKAIRQEGVSGLFRGTEKAKDIVEARKQEIAQEITKYLETANPVKSGKLVSDLEAARDALPTGSAGRPQLDNTIKKFSTLVDDTGKYNLKNIDEEIKALNDKVLSARHEAMWSPESEQLLTTADKLQATKDQLASIKAQDLAQRPADMLELMTEKGKLVLDRQTMSPKTESLAKEYQVLGKNLAEGVPEKQAFETAKRRSEIMQALEKSMGGGDTAVSLRSKPEFVRSVLNRYGSSLAAAGLGTAESLAKIPSAAAQALSIAAERGGPAAVMATHHTLMQKDKSYREAMTKKQESK